MTSTNVTESSPITEGMAITPYRVRPTTVQLFRFSAITWNSHRIHYDAAYARTEGYPGVLVQSHLHGCILVHAVLKWAGAGAELRSFRWRNRRIAVASNVLAISGTVTAITVSGLRRIVEVDLEERNEADDICVTGRAVVAMPIREG